MDIFLETDYIILIAAVIVGSTDHIDRYDQLIGMLAPQKPFDFMFNLCSVIKHALNFQWPLESDLRSNAVLWFIRNVTTPHKCVMLLHRCIF